MRNFGHGMTESMDMCQSGRYTQGRKLSYRCLRIHHTVDPCLANMGEKEDNGGNEGGPGSILSDLLAEGIKGFFWGPHGIQIGIGLTIIVVSKLMGYW